MRTLTFLLLISIFTCNSVFAQTGEKVMQQIDLKAGWNIISFNVIPDTLDLKTIFKPLIDNGKLVKVQDENGNALEDYGILGGWTNNIGNISHTEGYKIKVTDTCQLRIIGTRVKLPLAILVRSGWNIIGYPYIVDRNAMPALLQLINRGNLIKVQDENGNAMEDYGVFGGWQNNIGSFSPGEGYKIKISSNDTILFFVSRPLVTTSLPDSVSASSIIAGGNLVDNGGIPIIDSGICYGNTKTPTITDFKVSIGSGQGVFKNKLTGLSSNTIYYIRAFAQNEIGISYGESTYFKTEGIANFSDEQYVQAIKGDTIKGQNNTIIYIPSGALTLDGNVSISKTGDEPVVVPNPNLQIAGESYTLSLPCDTLTKSIEFSFILPKLSVPKENYGLYLHNGTSYYPIEYCLKGDTVKAVIDKITWESFQMLKTKEAEIISVIIVIGLINMQTPPTEQLGLKEVTLNDNNELIFNEPLANLNSKIVLFVHGWLGEAATWNTMIPWIKHENDFSNTKIWTFVYNSSISIEENGTILAQQLSAKLNGAKVDIVAHSMGGLVSRAMLEFNNGGLYANKLITLGTPHLGSPLAALQVVLGEFVNLDNSFIWPIYNSNSQGFKDLQESSDFIKKLKQSINRPVPYYLLSAYNDESQWLISKMISGADDGIVSVVSARGVNNCTIAPSVYIPVGEAHRVMPDNKDLYQQVLEYLRSGNLNGTFTDSRDGHVYKWVKIGNQNWMAENLAFLPSINIKTDESASEPMYYVYNNNSADITVAQSNVNFIKYGVLYNWPAAKVSCPAGWHLPNLDEWNTLSDRYGGDEVAGGDLKEAGTSTWLSPNVGATNKSGFTALPSGVLYTYNDTYSDVPGYGSWWSSDFYGSYHAYYKSLNYDNIYFHSRSYYKETGMGIRCIKD